MKKKSNIPKRIATSSLGMFSLDPSAPINPEISDEALEQMRVLAESIAKVLLPPKLEDLEKELHIIPEGSKAGRTLDVAHVLFSINDLYRRSQAIDLLMEMAPEVQAEFEDEIDHYFLSSTFSTYHLHKSLTFLAQMDLDKKKHYLPIFFSSAQDGFSYAMFESIILDVPIQDRLDIIDLIANGSLSRKDAVFLLHKNFTDEEKIYTIQNEANRTSPDLVIIVKMTTTLPAIRKLEIYPIIKDLLFDSDGKVRADRKTFEYISMLMPQTLCEQYAMDILQSGQHHDLGLQTALKINPENRARFATWVLGNKLLEKDEIIEEILCITAPNAELIEALLKDEDMDLNLEGLSRSKHLSAEEFEQVLPNIVDQLRKGLASSLRYEFLSHLSAISPDKKILVLEQLLSIPNAIDDLNLYNVYFVSDDKKVDLALALEKHLAQYLQSDDLKKQLLSMSILLYLPEENRKKYLDLFAQYLDNNFEEAISTDTDITHSLVLLHHVAQCPDLISVVDRNKMLELLRLGLSSESPALISNALNTFTQFDEESMNELGEVANRAFTELFNFCLDKRYTTVIQIASELPEHYIDNIQNDIFNFLKQYALKINNHFFDSTDLLEAIDMLSFEQRSELFDVVTGPGFNGLLHFTELLEIAERLDDEKRITYPKALLGTYPHNLHDYCEWAVTLPLNDSVDFLLYARQQFNKPDQHLDIDSFLAQLPLHEHPDREKILEQLHDYTRSRLHDIAGEHPIKLDKTGSETIVLPSVEESSIRKIRKDTARTWLNVYFSASEWKDAGFDYVPVEPILHVGPSQDYTEAYVVTANLRGRSLCLSKGLIALYPPDIQERIHESHQKIISTLDEMGVIHGHPHTNNFVLVPQVKSDGAIDLDADPRIYIIDFDAAMFGKDSAILDTSSKRTMDLAL